MADFEVREANVRDAPVIASLWLEATREVAEHESIYTPNISHKDLSKRLAKDLDNEVKEAYVVYADGALAAYATFRIEIEDPQFVPRRYLFIIDLDVAAKFRQRGLSRLLMSKLEEYARSHDIERIELSVAFADPRAKQVWKRHGFKPHMLVMHKNI